MRITNNELTLKEIEQKMIETQTKRWKILYEVFSRQDRADQREPTALDIAKITSVNPHYVNVVVSEYNRMGSNVNYPLQETSKDHRRHRANFTIAEELEMIESLEEEREPSPSNLQLYIQKRTGLLINYATANSMLRRNGYDLVRGNPYLQWKRVTTRVKREAVTVGEILNAAVIATQFKTVIVTYMRREYSVAWLYFDDEDINNDVDYQNVQYDFEKDRDKLKRPIVVLTPVEATDEEKDNQGNTSWIVEGDEKHSTYEYPAGTVKITPSRTSPILREIVSKLLSREEVA